MRFPRERLEELIYGGQLGRRFTQDSPVMPEVWFEYAQRHEAIDVLLTPFAGAGPGHTTPGALSVALRARLHGEGGPSGSAEKPGIAYNQSTVLARLRFDELIRVVLPMSNWWQQRVLKAGFIKLLGDPVQLQWLRKNEALVTALNDAGPAPIGTPSANYRQVDSEQKEAVRTLRAELQRFDVELTGDVLWMFRVVGAIAWVTSECSKRRAAGAEPERRPGKRPARGASKPAPADRPADDWLPPAAVPDDKKEFQEHQKKRRAFIAGAINAVVDLLERLPAPPPAAQAERPTLIYSINLNRTAQTTVIRSRGTIKADAATRLFDLHCDDITWAVVDSGIDATHPAFRERRSVSEEGPGSPSDDDPEAHAELYSSDVFKTRVVETYDFTRIESLLDINGVEDRIKEIEDRRRAREAAARQTKPRRGKGKGKGKAKAESDAAADGAAQDDLGEPLTAEKLESLRLLKWSLQRGKDLDWELLIPLLKVPHVAGEYDPPVHEHGTHVAGILAGDWGDKVTGICPDLRLYDMRVLNEQGQGSEFNAIAALQFIRYLKGKRDIVGIQGVNLSLAIRHEVANYACGRTPICDECERLIGAGIVVVAAAGNEGYQQYLAPKGAVVDAYRNISITDPGNAEGVITVGSTHRFQPHTYGVSYFSSRGPTGDGRAKPDLVAPGEKIGAPVPGAEVGVRLMDGTSMATPHVSGAAALLIARHRELAGQPERIKSILCKTATDLGRVRDFQGHGMVDILRALQSV